MQTSEDFAVAAFEFQRYLSDHVAPLMIEEEFGVLLRNPPTALVGATMHWMSENRGAQSDTATADRILHAVRKIALMGEFDLVPRAALGSFLGEYCREILLACPLSERARVGDIFASVIESLNSPERKAPEPREAPEPIQPKTVRRMEVFLDQLEMEAPGERRDEVASEFMATAALGSSSREELDATLAPLKGVGIDPATENVLNSIARSLPGWGALEIPAGAAPRRERLGAMRQIVTLGEDAEEVAKRFRELVHAAIAQFNQGDVGRAQSILVLAQQMAAEERIQAPYVESLRNASDYLDMARLRATVDKPESLPALRTIMSFFHALSPDGLLKSLRGEADENRRHDISSLLEAHGAVGRARALDLLDAADATSDPVFAASALRVLRRIPAPADGSPEREVNVILRHATRDTDPLVATQAIYCLGQAKDDRPLLSLLRNYEALLTRPAGLPSAITAEDIFGLLDRTCDALGRRSSAACLRALVDHGLKTQPELGDCAKRLAEGAHADFSNHPDLLARLVDGLRAELPRGVLGLRLRRELGRSASFVRALSGTPAPQVKALFHEIVRRHGDEEYGTLAAEALEAFAAKSRTPEVSASTFAGDLAFFGLPMLLQTLAQGAMTGVLTLIDGAGTPASKLWLLDGRLRHATLSRLSGVDALYELLIRPFPGTFAFVHRKDGPSVGALDPPRELMGLIFEGVRRHDEWKRSAALVGDDVLFAATGAPRKITTDEPDDFVEALWAMASVGSTARECEAGFAVDSHRVRKLLASWVEIDALKLG